MARQKNWSYNSYDEAEDISVIGNYIWDTGTLAWIKQTAAAGGGGGPVTIADGADVTQGSVADATWVSGNGTVISLLKKIASPGGGGLTDAELRATPVPVSGPLTDTQLRATAVPVSGTVGVSGTIPVSGPLTDLQLRAAAVAISGTVSIAGTVPVSGPLTDAQLRAVAVPVSGAFFQATQPVSIASTVQVDVTDEPTRDLGKVDIASLDQYTPVSGRLPVDGSGVVQPVSGPLTDAQLRATAVPVSGSVTAVQGAAGAFDWRADHRRGQTILFAAIDVAAAGDQTIVAADATRKIKVLSYAFVCDGIVNARWKSGAGTNLSGAMAFIANTGIAPPSFAPADGHMMETAVNQALVLNLSAAIGVRGHLSYFLEA